MGSWLNHTEAASERGRIKHPHYGGNWALESGVGVVSLVVTTDRTSNGPHLVYPAPSRPGGQPLSEDWVMENFRRDPWAGKAMVETAERVAAEEGITREEIDEITLLRYEQYAAGLADYRDFQRSYMVEAHVPARREPKVIDEDVGIHHTSAEGLAKLEPVVPGGVVTYGSQTHPADGTAGRGPRPLNVLPVGPWPHDELLQSVLRVH